MTGTFHDCRSLLTLPASLLLMSPHGHLGSPYGRSVDHVAPKAPRSPRSPGSRTPTPGRAVGPTGEKDAATDTAIHPVIMQKENELSRVFVDGRLVEGGDRCQFLAIHERSGTWAIYPHGVGKLGVRLSQADVETVAHAFLTAARDQPASLTL